MRWLYVLVASVVISTTLVVVATGASAAPKQQSPPKHFYGALDYSKAKHELYWGHGTSKASSNQAAYNHCRSAGAPDCVTWVWVYNG